MERNVRTRAPGFIIDLLSMASAPPLSESTSLSQDPSPFIHPPCEYQKKIRYVLASFLQLSKSLVTFLLNIAWAQLSDA